MTLCWGRAGLQSCGAASCLPRIALSSLPRSPSRGRRSSARAPSLSGSADPARWLGTQTRRHQARSVGPNPGPSRTSRSRQRHGRLPVIFYRLQRRGSSPLCAFKHVNSSSKSFVTCSCQGRPLCAQLVDGRDALVGRHLLPEVAVGRVFFGKRRALPDPQFHRVIIVGHGVSPSSGRNPGLPCHPCRAERTNQAAPSVPFRRLVARAGTGRVSHVQHLSGCEHILDERAAHGIEAAQRGFARHRCADPAGGGSCPSPQAGQSPHHRAPVLWRGLRTG
jgi:hypothetical protein